MRHGLIEAIEKEIGLNKLRVEFVSLLESIEFSPFAIDEQRRIEKLMSEKLREFSNHFPKEGYVLIEIPKDPVLADLLEERGYTEAANMIRG